MRISKASILVLLSSPLLLAGAQHHSASPHHKTQQHLPPAAATPALSPVLYAEAARALRNKDLQKASQLLDQVAVEHPRERANARLVAGLYAQAAGDAARAAEMLGAAASPGGALEDWRLYLLAASAATAGQRDQAQAAYARLISECPGSPLRPVAYLDAATLADRRGEPRLALALVDEAHAAGLGGATIGKLDALAWKVGRALADEQAEREAARRLLVEAPLSSDARDAATVLRSVGALGGIGGDGRIDWDRLLSPGEVVRRAQTFLDQSHLPAALSTLDGLPEADRDFDWHLLKAQALIQARRGEEALALLDGVTPAAAPQRASLEWQRALAAAATVAARGRQALPAGGRRQRLEEAHRHLANAVQLHAEAPFSPTALRALYRDFLDAGLFDAALDVLRVLRRLEPADTTGTAYLWERGWSEYRGGDHAAAVDTWTALDAIYPEQHDAQRGRYWRARALETLGQPRRALALYRDLVVGSDTDDFYRRRALARLGQGPVEGEALARGAAGPWPAAPSLQRAKLLSDLGLDELALKELELVAAAAPPRELLALRAMVLCRKGDRRDSLALLREAFPALGGANQASIPEEVLRAYYPLDFADAIHAGAAASGLPPYLIAGIIRQESAFDPRAQSRVGARGLMQLMPQTARDMARQVGIRFRPASLDDPGVSVRLGSRYFRQLLDGFGGNVELALASYNGGPNRIRRLWQQAGPTAQLDDFVENLGLEESRDYVKRILVLADSYRQLYPSLG
jgi:peptidoglycan lytic transglycosylase